MQPSEQNRPISGRKLWDAWNTPRGSIDALSYTYWGSLESEPASIRDVLMHPERGTCSEKAGIMQEPCKSEFKHRDNQDGTFDSICLRCFSTVCTACSESALTSAEETHSCSPVPGRAYQSMKLHIVRRVG